MVKYESKFDGIQNIQLEYGGTATQKMNLAHYSNTSKVIHSINELINYGVNCLNISALNT